MSAQIEAMCRLLEGSGDMTPMATRQILAVMATPANRPTPDHGAAGFCTNHYNGPWHYSLTAARPTAVAEAVEAGAWALAQEAPALGVDLRAFDGDEKRLSAAVLEAVGYADLLAEVERLRAGIAHIVDRYGNAPGIETCATMYDLRRLARVTP